MRPEAIPRDQAAGLRQAFHRPGLTVLPVCAPGRDPASQGWVVHVAAALAERGRHVVVLDADRGFVAPAFGLKARRELRHLLTGECEFSEAVLSAGTNLDVLPASRGLEMFLASGEDPGTLFEAFLALHSPAGILVVNGPVARIAPLVPSACEVLFVASPDRAAVTGVYGAIKHMERDFPGRVARIAVTGVVDDAQGEALAARIADATRRFLNHVPEFAHVARDHPELHEASRVASSVLGVAPDGAAAGDFRRIADDFDHWQLAHHAMSSEG
jgi:flagellar biosynthesis protein FlhG